MAAMEERLLSAMALLQQRAKEAPPAAGGEGLLAALADVRETCLQLLSDEEISFATSLIFDEEEGIFSAIEAALEVKGRIGAKVREQALQFVRAWVEKVGKGVRSHLAAIKEHCLDIFRRDESNSVKTAALSPLLSIFEMRLSPLNPVELGVTPSTIDMLERHSMRAKHANTLQAQILVLLGYFLEYFPSLFTEERVHALVKMALHILTLADKSDSSRVLIAGSIRCLDSLMTWFDGAEPAGGTVESSKKIYFYVKGAVIYGEHSRYDILKAGLRLLARHAERFWLQILDDAVLLFTSLQTLCLHPNAPVRDAALLALDAVIIQISKGLVNGDARVTSRSERYKALMGELLSILNKPNEEYKKVSTAILAIGRMAPAIMRFSGKEELSEVLRRLVPFGGAVRAVEGKMGETLAHGITSVQAFADICVHLDNIEDSMLAFITQVSVIIFYMYPELWPKQQPRVHAAIRDLLSALYQKGSAFNLFVTSTVHSCLERAISPFNGPPGDRTTQLWPQYVKLWLHLLSPYGSNRASALEAHPAAMDSPAEGDSTGRGDAGDGHLVQVIYDALVGDIIAVMKELDLTYVEHRNVKEEGTEKEPADGSEERTETHELEPVNPLHMHKFLNLVEFALELLSRSGASMFLQWVHPFCRTMIEFSTQYPLNSGFYKLLSIAIKLANSMAYFDPLSRRAEPNNVVPIFNSSHQNIADRCPKVIVSGSADERAECGRVVQAYLREVLLRLRLYTMELLSACLRLVLIAPCSLLDIASRIGPLRAALEMGTQHLPVAEVAVAALENWQFNQREELETNLPTIIPCLNEYLTEVVACDSPSYQSGPIPFPLAETMSARRTSKLRAERAQRMQTSAYEKLQVRVQRFLGRVGCSAHFLVAELDLTQAKGTMGRPWDSALRLPFTLPFRDEKPDLWLDRLLPRMAELAENSSDRGAKVSACEALHAVSVYMVGSAAKGPARRSDKNSEPMRYEQLYRNLFPAVLRLATDVDQVTGKLFREFSLQLIHWLTSNTQKESPDTMALLDAIMEGLQDANNGALRDLCAESFAEFLKWSIRHTPPKVDSYVNVSSMLRRLYYRMDHPSPYHRLGAAMALHRSYPTLYANPPLLDRYLLEVYFYCIASLRIAESDDENIGTVQQITLVMDAFLKLIARNIEMLRSERKERARFSSLQSFSLWLFRQTASVESHCRRACMKLFAALCPLLPEASPSLWLHRHFSHTLPLLQNLLPQHGPEGGGASLPAVELWLRHVARAFHWLDWAAGEGMVQLADIEELHSSAESFRITIAELLKICARVVNLNAEQWTLTPVLVKKPHSQELAAMAAFLSFCKRVPFIANGLAPPTAAKNSTEGNLEGECQGAEALTVDVGQGEEQKELSWEPLLPLTDPSFTDFLATAILTPGKVGLSSILAREAQEVCSLSVELLHLLSGCSNVFRVSMKGSLREKLQQREYNLEVLELQSLAEEPMGEVKAGVSVGSMSPAQAASLAKGYRQLHSAGILIHLLGKERVEGLAEHLATQAFNMKRECPPSLASAANEMVELSISLDLPVKRLLDFIINQAEVCSIRMGAEEEEKERKGREGNGTDVEVRERKRMTTAGEVFFLNFHRQIVRYCKFYYHECLESVFLEATNYHSVKMLLNALLDDYITRLGKVNNITLGSFLRECVRRIPLLRKWCEFSSSFEMKTAFLGILKKLFILDVEGNVVLEEDEETTRFIVDNYLTFLLGNCIESLQPTAESQESMAFKADAVSLLHFFFQPRFRQKEWSVKLFASVSRFVAEHLLLRDDDIPKGSEKRASFLKLVENCLFSLSHSRSLDLLEAHFPLLLVPNSLVFPRFVNAMDAFAENIKTMPFDALELCIRSILDSGQAPHFHKAVGESVAEPILRACGEETLVTWFSSKAEFFLSNLERDVSQSDSWQDDFERQEKRVILRRCLYRMLEILFDKVSAPLLKEKFSPLVPNNKLISRANDDMRAKHDPPHVSGGDSSAGKTKALWRELHVAAYNLCCTLIIRTQSGSRGESVFAGFLFREDAKMGRLWEHLIDCDKVYSSLPVVTTQLQGEIETIRDLRARWKLEHSNAALTMADSFLGTFSSQYLIGPTLSQEPAVIPSFVGRPQRRRSLVESLRESVPFSRDEEEDGEEEEEEEVIGRERGMGTLAIGRDSKEVEPSDVPMEAAGLSSTDMDEFDLHPCMPRLLKVIEAVHERYGETHREAQTMREWMKAMLVTMNNASTPINVRLFLAKAITKCGTCFAPYGEACFRPLLLAVLEDPQRGGGESYFHPLLRAICLTLLAWNLQNPPDSPLATRLVCHLMRVACHDVRAVLAANVSIIRLFLEQWKDIIVLDKEPVVEYLRAGGKQPKAGEKMVKIRRFVGLQLLGALCVCGMPLYDPVYDVGFTEKELYVEILFNLAFKAKEVYEAAAEVIGMLLRKRQELLGELIDEFELEAPLRSQLVKMFKEGDFDRFLYILNRVTLRFPTYSGRFGNMVLDLLPRVQGGFKSICLSILLRKPDEFPDLPSMLLPYFPSLLQPHDEQVQMKVVQLTSRLLNNFSKEALSVKVVPILRRTFRSHESPECRQLYYDAMTTIYGRKDMQEEGQLLVGLLEGLTDTSPDIRMRLLQFWHMQLPRGVAERAVELLGKIYDPLIEERWPQTASSLLLKLCEDSVDYERPIFEAPLAECEFHELPLSAWNASSLPMTPLFSSASTRPSFSHTSVSSQTSAPTQAMVRSTMELSPSLSQTEGDSSLLSHQALGSSDSFGSSLIALSQSGRGLSLMHAEGGVGRRGAAEVVERMKGPFRGRDRSHILRATLNAQRRRAARLQQQASQRASRVELMRRYRTGELPDIQIKHSELIRALSSLAEKDAPFGGLLLSALWRCVQSLPDTHSRNMETQFRAPVRAILGRVMERTRGTTAFVGCVGALALEDAEVCMRPDVVSNMSVKSGNLHSGILLLEGHLLHNTQKLPETPKAKRRKAADGSVEGCFPEADHGGWAELARLYAELGEDDVVLGIYSCHVAQEAITKRALEAQLGGDPLRALQLYDEGIKQLDADGMGMWEGEGSLKHAEASLWYSQRYACLEALRQWRVLLDDVLLQLTDEGAEPHLERLWESKEQEIYLSPFIRSAIKVPMRRPMLTCFVQAASMDPEKWSLLLRSFGTQLLTLSVANGQFDLARFQTALCYRAFRQNWTVLNPLATRRRHAEVCHLQKIVELEEFLQLSSPHSSTISLPPGREPPFSSFLPLSSSDPFVQTAPPDPYTADHLLATWRLRWPSWQFDGVEAWDDVICNRLMLMEKMQSRDNVVQRRERGEREAPTVLAAKLQEERAGMFRTAARAFRKQGNLTVAQALLDEHVAATVGSSNNGRVDFAFLKALVKLRCLQARREVEKNPAHAAALLSQVLEDVEAMKKEATLGGSKCEMLLLNAQVSSQLAWMHLRRESLSDGGIITEGELTAHLRRAFEGFTKAAELAELTESEARWLKESMRERKGNAGAGRLAAGSLKDAAKASLKFALFLDEAVKIAAADGAGEEGKGPDHGRQELQSNAAVIVRKAFKRENNSSKGYPCLETFPPLIVTHMMKAFAMKSSFSSGQGLARVLSLLREGPAARDAFAKSVPSVPSWLFIAWIPQMLTAMDSPEGETLLHVLKAIAREYPHALYFPLRVSEEDFSEVAMDRTAELRSILKSETMESFARALEDLTFPQQRLLNGLVDIQMEIQEGDSRKAISAYTRMFEDCLDAENMRSPFRKAGQYNVKFATDYRGLVEKALGKGGCNLKGMSPEHLKTLVQKISATIAKTDKNAPGRVGLSSFSDWLAEYGQHEGAISDFPSLQSQSSSGFRPWPVHSSGTEGGFDSIEVPGQYGMLSEAPNPAGQVHLVGFHPLLQVFSSKQRPKLLVVRGSDEMEHKFVVKGGEDLRLDERVQQLFQVMNGVLRRDGKCARRRLQMRTFSVIPVSKRCGLLQYVENTETLRSMVERGLGAVAMPSGSGTPDQFLNHLTMEYGQWVAKKSKNKALPKNKQYERMICLTPPSEVEQNLLDLEAKLPWNVLRTAIAGLTRGPESFLSVRFQLARSLAVLCIAGYVAGVGDRHLNNFLIDIRDGTLVAIDFGMSFGTATQLLPVPELQPFRLTRQLVSFLSPLNAKQLLRSEMVRTLESLRGSKHVLGAVMDVFVREPLLDWKVEAMKKASLAKACGSNTRQEKGDESELVEQDELSAEQKHVQLKIENAHRKLDLWNPKEITLLDLRSSIHASNPGLLRTLEDIARGRPEKNVRARVGHTCESVQEQVDCLLDQATDRNVLGRLWEGWNAWV